MKAADARAKRSAEKMESQRYPNPGRMLAPKSVALIGASEKPGSVGRALLENLLPFRGYVFPVNRNHSMVLDRKTFPTIRDVLGDVDLAVIATPAATVPQIVSECAAAGVRGAVIISAGFKESGPAGAELEKEILARRGPNANHWPELCGRDVAAHRFERDLRETAGASRQYRVYQPERRALHGDSRLEPVEPARLQRLHFHRLDGRCELGRSDLLPRR